MMTAREIRRTFLRFFEERGHTVVPSSPVFPKDDPTLLFTNAGMNQFKDVFLGTGRRPYTRAVDTQKCIRVSGKHNDLEEVGRDTYHHTFFEMLGNWSFGDYFKREAIAWSWELLTRVYGLPRERLWVTVFSGDAADGLPADEEAAALWTEVTDIDPSRVLRFGRRENFWEMGETGPCGPCTEIHIDRGGPGDDPRDGADLRIGVNAGNERFMEIWNNVFIQFDRKADGRLEPLPARHVDTGMGFERLCAVIQGCRSNYDTDLFRPLFDRLAALTGRRHAGTAAEADVACRVVADHVRALTVAIADGALPGNEGRGYVLRRLLRRAARFGRQHLGQERPFIHGLVPPVVESLGDAFPEIAGRADHVQAVIEAEEAAFLLTLDRGIALFEGLARKVQEGGLRSIPGDQAYDLYATYGFPRDLVDLMAREHGLAVDEAGWRAAEAGHREASRGEGTGRWIVDPTSLAGLPATLPLCHPGPDHDGLRAEARPLRLVEGRALVLDRTPFYAEGGGQVGDQGHVEAPGFRFRVDDTRRMGDVILHLGALLEGDPGRLPVEVVARVDPERRLDTMANHTATHLLHAALREVLGEHATQQGSLVAPDRLRFDVTHPRAITPEEIERIERIVNARIAEALPVQTTIEDLAAAKSRGVVALFGEKYDDRVRVVAVGEHSTELCGGTHCRNSGQIGAFAIVSETAVSAGVRRLEAVTRGRAVQRFQEQRRLLRELAQLVKAPETELVARVGGLHERIRELQKGQEGRARKDLAGLARRLRAEGSSVGSATLVVAQLEGMGPADLAPLCDHLRAAGSPSAGLLALEDGGKAVLAAFSSKELAGLVHAGDVVRAVAPLIGGGGGGRPDFAQAGGKDAAGIPAALERGRALLSAALGGSGAPARGR
jgi:alanyl-tRNA synthetase